LCDAASAIAARTSSSSTRSSASSTSAESATGARFRRMSTRAPGNRWGGATAPTRKRTCVTVTPRSARRVRSVPSSSESSCAHALDATFTVSTPRSSFTG
jgi:hypothetical protein